MQKKKKGLWLCFAPRICPQRLDLLLTDRSPALLSHGPLWRFPLCSYTVESGVFFFLSFPLCQPAFALFVASPVRAPSASPPAAKHQYHQWAHVACLGIFASIDSLPRRVGGIQPPAGISLFNFLTHHLRPPGTIAWNPQPRVFDKQLPNTHGFGSQVLSRHSAVGGGLCLGSDQGGQHDRTHLAVFFCLSVTGG